MTKIQKQKHFSSTDHSKMLLQVKWTFLQMANKPLWNYLFIKVFWCNTNNATLSFHTMKICDEIRMKIYFLGSFSSYFTKKYTERLYNLSSIKICIKRLFSRRSCVGFFKAVSQTDCKENNFNNFTLQWKGNVGNMPKFSENNGFRLEKNL